MGARIWSVHKEHRMDDGMFIPAHIAGPFRVLSFKQFLEAEPPKRKKHLVQLWCDPGGLRTLAVGTIRLKDPGRAAAMRARHERGDFLPGVSDADED